MHTVGLASDMKWVVRIFRELEQEELEESIDILGRFLGALGTRFAVAVAYVGRLKSTVNCQATN